MRLRVPTVMAAVAALVAIAAPSALASRAAGAAQAQQAQAQLSAQIRYTTGGIPHILAHSWTSWPRHGNCPVGDTILTYSESSNPASPHFADQTKLFSKKQFLPDRFCPAQIAADPNLRVTTVTAPAR